jgi:hypothetical protein
VCIQCGGALSCKLNLQLCVMVAAVQQLVTRVVRQSLIPMLAYMRQHKLSLWRQRLLQTLWRQK